MKGVHKGGSYVRQKGGAPKRQTWTKPRPTRGREAAAKMRSGAGAPGGRPPQVKKEKTDG